MALVTPDAERSPLGSTTASQSVDLDGRVAVAFDHDRRRSFAAELGNV